MKTSPKSWTKAELKTFILLVCAKADDVETDQELKLIRSKMGADNFDTMYAESQKYDRDQSLEKIRDAVQHLEYSYWELGKLRKEIHEVFAADHHIPSKERQIGEIMDHLLY